MSWISSWFGYSRNSIYDIELTDSTLNPLAFNVQQDYPHVDNETFKWIKSHLEDFHKGWIEDMLKYVEHHLGKSSFETDEEVEKERAKLLRGAYVWQYQKVAKYFHSVVFSTPASRRAPDEMKEIIHLIQRLMMFVTDIRRLYSLAYMLDICNQYYVESLGKVPIGLRPDALRNIENHSEPAKKEIVSAFRVLFGTTRSIVELAVAK